jgi:hypothetical protein
MASLLEVQRAFAAALRDPQATCAVTPPANLAIYRNNTASAFRGALEISFPVLRARVGDDYFRQLAARYRQAFPSRSGDLHWVGKSFAAFLADHLRDGDYAWLADLARLEWACEEVAVDRELEPIGLGTLATVALEDLERVQFALQPSLRLIASPYPVLSVWFANQAENASPVDQSKGSECGIVLMRNGDLALHRVGADLFNYLEAVAGGATLGEAMQLAMLDERRLTEVLGFLFSEGLVVSMTVKKGLREES